MEFPTILKNPCTYITFKSAVKHKLKDAPLTRRNILSTLCSVYEDYNDLTSPTSNLIPDIPIAVSVVYSLPSIHVHIVKSFIFTVR